MHTSSYHYLIGNILFVIFGIYFMLTFFLMLVEEFIPKLIGKNKRNEILNMCLLIIFPIMFLLVAIT